VLTVFWASSLDSLLWSCWRRWSHWSHWEGQRRERDEEETRLSRAFLLRSRRFRWLGHSRRPMSCCPHIQLQSARMNTLFDGDRMLKLKLGFCWGISARDLEPDLPERDRGCGQIVFWNRIHSHQGSPREGLKKPSFRDEPESRNCVERERSVGVSELGKVVTRGALLQ